MGGRLPSVQSLGDVAGRRVFVRADLNVPLDGTRITDDGRIRASVATIRELTGRGARVVVGAHLGRPKGQRVPELTLRPAAERLGELLAAPVAFTEDVAGDDAAETVRSLDDGGVALLENLRFESAETSPSDAERAAFADRLAGLTDCYVDDAFGAIHRKHASVYDLPARLPHAAGELVLRELAVLRRLTEAPERPYVVILGGAKVSDKLGVIARLLERVDRLLIGGGMCYTFLAAQGHEVGDSLLEADQLDACRGFLELAASRGIELRLPSDIVAAAHVEPDAACSVVDAERIPPGFTGLDIGPATVAQFAAALTDARTVFWNGPMGVFELDAFANGTKGVAAAVAEVSAVRGGFTVIGGGDSAAAVRALGLDDASFGHISTGGGASLEYLEGRDLPGLLALAVP
ncbi:MAG TPA: phosphoglycerate kinase [Mycobacteriales bacterium]|nr:phosphoglycerate kinase [Mycobacteriales bacterium]